MPLFPTFAHFKLTKHITSKNSQGNDYPTPEGSHINSPGCNPAGTKEETRFGEIFAPFPELIEGKEAKIMTKHKKMK